jgi:hypothetical protein
MNTKSPRKSVAILGGTTLVALLVVAFALDRFDINSVWFMPAGALVLLGAIRLAGLNRAR